MKTFPLSLGLVCLTIIAISQCCQLEPASPSVSRSASPFMTSPLELSETSQVATIRRHGSDILWVAPGGATSELKAFIGNTKVDEEASGQMTRNRTVAHLTDFIIPTADLPAEVTRTIELELRGGRYRPSSNGGEPFAVISRHGHLTRIHTTRVKT